MHLDEPSKEKHKMLDCLPLSPVTSKSSFLHRSNSLIQENTIEEVDENCCKSAQELILPGHDTLNTSITEQLATIGTPLVDPSNKEYEQKEDCLNDSQAQPSRIPLPPCVTAKDDEVDSEIFPCNGHCEKELKGSVEQLMIIEEGDNVTSTDSIAQIKQSEILACDINTAKVTEEESTEEPNTPEDSIGKSEVELAINKSSFSIFDEEEDTCEHLLEEAETEVVFEIPDYVNVTSPSIPPRPICENMSM